jgi:REP element-mobilizing transposase RayT
VLIGRRSILSGGSNDTAREAASRPAATKLENHVSEAGDSRELEISYKPSGGFLTAAARRNADACRMTYARSILVPPGSPGTYHCVSRCVRRAWLCGEDRESGRSYEHRRQWVEDRIGELAGIFAVAVWGYAVMSNHLHVVVQVIPQAAAHWSAEEVAAKWLRLYSRRDRDASMRAEALAGNESAEIDCPVL